MTAARVNHQLGYCESRNPIGSFLHQPKKLFLHLRDTAHTGANDYAAAIGIFL